MNGCLNPGCKAGPGNRKSLLRPSSLSLWMAGMTLGLASSKDSDHGQGWGRWGGGSHSSQGHCANSRGGPPMGSSVHTLSIYQAAWSTKDWCAPLRCPGGPQTGLRADRGLFSLRKTILRGMDSKMVVPVFPGHKRPQLRLLHFHPQTRSSELSEMGSGRASNHQQQPLPRREVRVTQTMGGGPAACCPPCLTGKPGAGAGRGA